MGKDSAIEWTHHTFNPWWGCIRVSPGCEHCYAETLAKRYGHAVWGAAKTTARREFGDKHWAEPLKWNRDAKRAGERKRVFCSSMADVFEDHPQLPPLRERLWELIEQTPWLDWLLLTKRAEHMTSMAPASWAKGWPANVWAMTSVENQEYADRRIPELLKVPARVRGLSCEPLLGPVDLAPWVVPAERWELDGYFCDRGDCDNPAVAVRMDGNRLGSGWLPVCDRHRGIHWVIVGGESGPKARPMHPDWARSLRDQCQAAGAAFHFKQWGEWLPIICERDDDGVGKFIGADGRRIYIPDMLAHAHEVVNDRGIIRLGKKAAGRLLDGREWNEFPQVQEHANA